MSLKNDIHLLTIRGALKPRTREEARNVHNLTAGNPAGVAAARALGDLSHNVYVNLFESAPGTAGELLILDLWNNLEGFQKFFSDHQVQEGGGMIFASRDPVLWTKAHDIASFALPTPAGKHQRFVGLVRGMVKSREAAKAAFDQMTNASINAARMAGAISHEVYFRAPSPGHEASLEVLGVDVWMDAAGMAAYYQDPDHLAPLRTLFTAAPVTSTWQQPEGSWVEW